MTKFHKILIKDIRVRERTSFKTVTFHKQRAINTESLVRYRPTIFELEEDIRVLNNVTKFHKILIKIFELESGHRMQLEEYFVCYFNVWCHFKGEK